MSFGFLLVILHCFCVRLHAQEARARIDSIVEFPEKTYARVTSKVEDIELKLNQKTKAYLAKLEKEEQKIRRRLGRKDSMAVKEIFTNTEAIYTDLYQKYQQKTGQVTRKARNYFPMLDSVKTALKFMDEYSVISNEVKTGFEKVKTIKQSVNSLDEQFQKAETISELIETRGKMLEQQLSKYGLGRYVRKYREEAYYYTRQIREYKAVLSDPDKILAESMRHLTKLPAFRDFMKKHSDLAKLFPIPGASGNAAIINSAGIPQLQGLQTRMQVQSAIQNQLSQSGPNAQQIFQQGVQQARSYLDMLKEKLNSLGGSTAEDLEMPDHFKPNSQRTKSFWNRLEYGMNIQGTKANGYWPLTTDFGASVGYKINDKSVIGIGVSYKVGWGEGIQDIRVTSEGVGLRSFIDWKVKGRFYVTGGAEFNYRNSFSSITVLKDYSQWQKSALLGATMKYSIGKKWKGNVQLLYDALWQKQVPQTQPVLFRTGYSF